MKKNAFTLIELLATIVIIGVLSTIAIASYSKRIKTMDDKYYDTQVGLMEAAGQNYFSDNKDQLKDDGYTDVKLRTLISNKYIDKIKYNKKDDCDIDNSYVVARKSKNNEYTYTGCLKCGDKEYGVCGFYKVTFGELTKKYYKENDTITIDVTITNDYSVVDSYKYNLYNSKNEVVSTGEKSLNEDISITVTNQINEGIYHMGVIPIDTNGKELTEEVFNKNIIVDKTSPSCKIELSDGVFVNPDWYRNSPTRVQYLLSDNEALQSYYYGIQNNIESIPKADEVIYNTISGTVKTYSKMQNLDIDWNHGYAYIYIKDKAGNTNSCRREFKVDSSDILCEFTYYYVTTGIHGAERIDVINPNSELIKSDEHDGNIFNIKNKCKMNTIPSFNSGCRLYTTETWYTNIHDPRINYDSYSIEYNTDESISEVSVTFVPKEHYKQTIKYTYLSGTKKLISCYVYP